MSRYIPYNLHWDYAPLDISFVFNNEKPAGKHGFLTTKGTKLVFEDGTVARFFGTLTNSGMNFCPHDHADTVAHRMASFGVNLVRLHQMDADFASPNIFNFSRGVHEENTLSFDPRSLDRLDYFQAALKREGIYVYVDGINHRKFKTGDGVRSAEKVDRRAGRPFSLFDERMMELNEKYNHDLMTHRNPYTGLRWCDDPAVAFFSEGPELNIQQLPTFDKWPIEGVEPYETELIEKYVAWAAEQGLTVDAKTVHVDSKTDVNLRKFYMYLEEKYYKRMTEKLRADGVRIPLIYDADAFSLEHLSVISKAQLSDDHLYWWAGDQRSFMSNPISSSFNTHVEMIGLARVGNNRPHMISEWDAPWPNHYRAEAPIFTAAMACFQGVSGMTVHTYRYGCREDELTTSRLGRSVVIGDSYYRGTFDTYNDPAKFGLFYHAALMMRRGDVKEAKEWVAIRLPKQEDTATTLYPKDVTARMNGDIYRHHVCSLLAGMDSIDGTEIPYDQASAAKTENSDAGEIKIVETGEAEKPKRIVSDTGELIRDLENSVGIVDAERTKAVYGFIGGHKIELNGLTVTGETDFGVVALSSLSDDSLEKSKNILLTAVGRAQNTGYEDEVLPDGHRRVTNHGTGPVMVEAIEAQVRLKTEHRNQRVYSIDEDGYITGTLPITYENGELVFSIGKEFAQMYYLIQTI